MILRLCVEGIESGFDLRSRLQMSGILLMLDLRGIDMSER
jgi:hypothetical protein